MDKPIDLSAERERRRPPSMPPSGDLFEAVRLITEYADRLTKASVQDWGAVDLMAYKLTAFADVIAECAVQMEDDPKEPTRHKEPGDGDR